MMQAATISSIETQGGYMAESCDFSDFDGWNLPPESIAWLIQNLPSGSRILELGAGKSTRELTRFFSVTAIEENPDYTRYEGVHYVLAPFKDGWYDSSIVCPILADNCFDAVIIDGPFAGLSRIGCRLRLLRFFHMLRGTPHLIVDDIERLPDLILFFCLALRKRTKLKIFFSGRKACAVIDGVKSMQPSDLLNALPHFVKLFRVCAVRTFKSVFRLLFRPTSGEPPRT